MQNKFRFILLCLVYFICVKDILCCRSSVHSVPSMGILRFRQIHLLTRPLRLWTISDLHTDSMKNLEYIRTMKNVKADRTAFEVLVISGDVSRSVVRLRESLAIMQQKFDHVMFVPGNHDLWITAENEVSSDGKLHSLLHLCEDMGIGVRPTKFLGDDCQLWVVPLLSWYHSSWDEEPDVFEEEKRRNGNFVRRWADFRYCKWSEDVSVSEKEKRNNFNSTILADYFASFNADFISEIKSIDAKGAVVISFSHFLPRQELSPEKRFLHEPNLMKVIGSRPLEQQIREIGSDVHIFGHLHIPIDLEIENIRYLQWPLGTPREHFKQCKCVFEHGPLLVYSTVEGDIINTSKKYLSDTVKTFWGSYYKSNSREAHKASIR